jgi:3-deoxy-D-manno-octulosonate 8-phosphate phosphatase (KDO 8-P phosphatase)
MDIAERARAIKLLIMDVDGTLTDGRLFFGTTGEELKVFNVRDGLGLTMWHRAGGKSGVISGRNSAIVDLRMSQLGVEFVWQGRDDKIAAFDELIDAAGVKPEEVAFIGDDTPDAELFPLVGFAVAVADAHETVIDSAHYVTKSGGGRGAIRDLIDLLLGSRS